MDGRTGAYAMKRVAAGAHRPTLWLFEPTKRSDDRADCLRKRVGIFSVFRDEIVSIGLINSRPLSSSDPCIHGSGVLRSNENNPEFLRK